MSNHIAPERVVQIIPAERGWHTGEMMRDAEGKPRLQDGNVQWVWSEIACWALTSDGFVVPMIAGDGRLELPESDASIFSPDQSWDYEVAGIDGLAGDAELVAPLGPGEFVWRRIKR